MIQVDRHAPPNIITAHASGQNDLTALILHPFTLTEQKGLAQSTHKQYCLFQTTKRMAIALIGDIVFGLFREIKHKDRIIILDFKNRWMIFKATRESSKKCFGFDDRSGNSVNCKVISCD